MFNPQPKAVEALTELSGHIRALRPSSLYVLVATTALMPLAQAIREGDHSAYMALGRLTTGEHTDRLADLLQTWKDSKTALRATDEALDDIHLRREIDATLMTLDAFGTVQHLLKGDDEEWFTTKLRRELTDMGNLYVLDRVSAPGAPLRPKAAATLPKLPEVPDFGMVLNQTTLYQRGRHSRRSLPAGCPTWANPRQREKWGERGVVLWDTASQTITRLWAAQALEALQIMRTSHDSEKQGLTVGEPAISVSLKEPNAKPQHVLTDQMVLSPDRARLFREWLVTQESVLTTMAQADEEHEARVFSQLYDMILSWPVTKKPEGKSDETISAPNQSSTEATANPPPEQSGAKKPTRKVKGTPKAQGKSTKHHGSKP
jgi:hypothetical protein